jgi:hypothetical protein
MATKIATLTPSQWCEVCTLPADGVPHNVPGVAFRATRFPATRLKVEHVIAETQFGTLRRRFVNGKWQATEYINV